VGFVGAVHLISYRDPIILMNEPAFTTYLK